VTSDADSGAASSLGASPPAPARPASQAPASATAALVLLVVLFHGPSLANGFVYDDAWTVASNPILRNPGNLTRLLGPELARAGFPDAGRPTMLASEILDHALFGLQPWGYHLQSLIWHLGVVLLFYAGLRRLHGSLPIPLAAAALVAVHPVDVEAVAAINYREDLLAAFFLLLCLTATEKARATSGRFGPVALRAVAVLAALVAALAKENAYVAPLLLVLLDACRPVKPVRWIRWTDPLLLALAAGLVFAWRWWVMGDPGLVSRGAEIPHQHPQAAFTSGRAILVFFHGLLQFLWPRGFAPEYPAPAPAEGAAGLALLSLGLLMGGLLGLRKRAPWFALGLLGAVIAYLPNLGLLPLTNLRADRYFYLPSLGFAWAVVLAVAAALDRFPRLRDRTILEIPVVGLAACAVLLFLGMRSLEQGRIWRHDVALFSAAIRTAPGSQRAWIGLAGAKLRAGNLLDALGAAERALGLGDDFHSRQMYGLVLLAQGDAIGARIQLGRALSKGPPAHHRAQILNNLGYAELKLGRTEEALPRFALARKLDPHFDRPWLNAARVLLDHGDQTGAAALLGELLQKTPESIDGWKQLGSLHEAAGRPGLARAAYQRAKALSPDDRDVERALERLGR
jgi:tetratricopeptide (TPR) repeat protein